MPTNYQLNTSDSGKPKEPILKSLKRFMPFITGEGRNITATVIAVIVSSLAALVTPIIIGHTIDTSISTKDYNGILFFSMILFAIFVIGSLANYLQTKSMGGVGRRSLFNLRNAIFMKLQNLPVSFFNQNRVGDLISRINNDTDKINQFVSQGLIQFVGNVFLMVGTGIFMLFLNPLLGIATLLPALGVFIITNILSSWVKRRNLESLRSLGNISSEIQESLGNFKAIVAFNRLDYFRKKFQESNDRNYTASTRAGIAGNIFLPIYGLSSNLAQIIALCFGIYLITKGDLTIGLLIGFQFYVNNFYTPLRQIASMWSSFQLALASLDRISEVLSLESDMETIEKQGIRAPSESPEKGQICPDILEFQDVSFHYPDGRDVLHRIGFCLERGKTYALVGPTGGGKTTTASLMARLYDPSSGIVLLAGKDIRTYDPEERTRKIGFILQEPFLFSGTVRDNIFYGNEEYKDFPETELDNLLGQAGLLDLLSRFEGGLDTPVVNSGESISLGQKQLIAFMRAVLRKPELLILDEATANVDTVTEQLLETILEKLPEQTTRVIIAHRLNTIKNADRIFFVNAGSITSTDSVESALELLLHRKREG
ncbi:MAG: ABC transporter ATP-binding protein [Candidatus Gracilibacteria bacterium]|nr:ABC transporter ATP-binding protein [Candidatus Gracilibacteria bacterium]